MCKNCLINEYWQVIIMFIEFNVKNFRSLLNTQTLTMTASKYYNELVDINCFESGITGLPKLLRAAVIYGPNAAGKSNIIRALNFMINFILKSHELQEGQTINTIPFVLSDLSKTEPSEFEIFFIQDKIRYQYGFAVNQTRVTKEWLLAYPEGRAQRWYERSYDENTDNEKWYFGSKFIGRRQLLQEATRKNALFLSTAILLNNEQLKPIFEWFQNKIATILPDRQLNLKYSIEQSESEAGKRSLMDFMTTADRSIADIEIKRVPIQPLKQELLPLNMPQELKKRIVDDSHAIKAADIRFLHKNNNGESVSFRFEDESDGTKRLFAFAGPLLDVIERGRTLFVDELGTSLHPIMVQFLIGIIQNPYINKNNAQLIFTTHDTTILDSDILRRDQIWFVEKNNEQASNLYPLSDFRPRKGEALEKNYLAGRYGALPFIGDLRF